MSEDELARSRGSIRIRARYASPEFRSKRGRKKEDKPRKFGVPRGKITCPPADLHGRVMVLVKYMILWSTEDKTSAEKEFLNKVHLHLGIHVAPASFVAKRKGQSCRLCSDILRLIESYLIQHREGSGLEARQRVKSLDRHLMTEADIRQVATVVMLRYEAMNALESDAEVERLLREAGVTKET